MDIRRSICRLRHDATPAEISTAAAALGLDLSDTETVTAVSSVFADPSGTVFDLFAIAPPVKNAVNSYIEWGPSRVPILNDGWCVVENPYLPPQATDAMSGIIEWYVGADGDEVVGWPPSRLKELTAIVEGLRPARPVRPWEGGGA